MNAESLYAKPVVPRIVVRPALASVVLHGLLLSVLTANWGGAISKNPYLSFKFKGGAPGETIKISWVDNMGESDSSEAPIK